MTAASGARAGVPRDAGRGAESRPLLQILGVATGVAIAVGGTIGSGIFRTPGPVAAELGDARLILALWLVGGLVFVCGALSYAELGSRYPRSGGLFTYIHRAYGDGAGFVYGSLFALVIGPAPSALLAVVFGEYAVRLTRAPEALIPLLAGGAILLFGGMNYVGLRLGARVQNSLTAAKVLGFAGFALAAFLHAPAEGAGAPYAGANRATAGLLAALALAFQSVVFAYDGFSDPLKVGEEIDRPERNVPRALIGGVVVITAVYLMMNAAYLWALPVEAIARSKLPAGDAAARLFGGAGDSILASLAIVSVLGTLSESLLVNPRIAYAMAREGLLFRALRRVNQGGTPTIAMVLNTALAFTIAVTGTFDQLLTLIAFALALGELAAIGSLFVFRRRYPESPPPFRVPGYPVVPAIFFLVHLGLAVSILALRTRYAVLGLAVVGGAALVYAIALKAAGGGRPEPQTPGVPPPDRSAPPSSS